jgi:hypothetical protein
MQDRGRILRACPLALEARGIPSNLRDGVRHEHVAARVARSPTKDLQVVVHGVRHHGDGEVAALRRDQDVHPAVREPERIRPCFAARRVQPPSASAGGPRSTAAIDPRGCYDWGQLFGESHSPVVHELWVLVVAGSNPASPTLLYRGNLGVALRKRAEIPAPSPHFVAEAAAVSTISPSASGADREMAATRECRGSQRRRWGRR